MNCISCGSHSGDGLLCSGCSGHDISVPAFNLVGSSLLTEVRRYGAARIDLGPLVKPGVRIAPLLDLNDELAVLRERAEMGQETADVVHDFQRLLINAGMSESAGPGTVLYTAECSQASEEIMHLAEILRENGAIFSARTENLLGNFAWLRSPAFQGKRTVDSKSRNFMLAEASNVLIEYYDRALSKDPEFIMAHKNRALILYLAKRDDEAIEACKTVNERWPRDSEAWILRGNANMRKGDNPEAIRCFDSALMITPKDPMTWMHKAQALASMEKLPESRACFERSLQLEPNNPEALDGIGDVLTRLGEIDRAVESYDRAKNLMPKPAFVPKRTPKEQAPAQKPVIEPEPPKPEVRVEPPAPEIHVTPEPEEHPPEKMAKEPVELELEAELEAAIGGKDIPEIPAEEETVEEEPVPESPVEPPTEKTPRSLAEMFMGGLNIPEEPEEEAEEEAEEDEWPSLPDEVELPDNGNEEDEPVLGPLMGIPNGKPRAEETPEADDVLGEIEEIETQQELEAVMEKETDPTKDALRFMEAGDYEGALRVTEELLENEPNNIRAWLAKGDIHYEMDEYSKAQESYEVAIGLDRDNVEAWQRKGDCQNYLEDHEGAILSFNEVIERDRESTDAWLGIGDAFLGLDREDDAYKCYDKVTALNPRIPEGWSRLGDVLIMKGRWGGAMQMYDRAVKADPEFMEAYVSKAAILMKRGLLDEADKVYARMLEVLPTDLDALTGRVEILIRKGKWGAALQSLNNVIKHHRENARVWALQGDAYREQGNVAQAKAPYDKALELDPEDFTALVGKGQLMFDNGGYNEAIELFRKAIDADSENPFVWRYLGEAQREIGKEKDAIRSLEMATELGDNVPENWLAYGKALHEAGRYPEAIEAFEKVIKLQPGHQEAVKWREQSAKRLLKEVG